MTNSAEQPVDFKCFLYAKGYRRQRDKSTALGVDPGPHCLPLPQRQGTLGKELTLEAEEIGGERVLEMPLHRRRSTAHPQESCQRRRQRPAANDRQTLHEITTSSRQSRHD